MAKKKLEDFDDDLNVTEDSDEIDSDKAKAGHGPESFKLAQFWKDQIEQYEQGMRRWWKRGNTVIKRFRDERNRMDEEGQRRMNLLWANYKVMKPAIYSKSPVPVVDRTFTDHDPKGRLSSQMLERTLINQVRVSGFHKSISRAVDDRLLPGRGIVWMRYVPKFGKEPSLPAQSINSVEDSLREAAGKKPYSKDKNDTKAQKLEETQETVIAEKVEVDYVDWQDFYHFPPKARVWEEVQAIGKRIHITKKQASEAFGKEIARELKPDTTPIQNMSTTERQTFADTTIFQDIHERNIVVFEIWNKSDRRVYWVSPSYDYLCKVTDDPLEIEEFFPVPAPLCATITNDTLIPVPDYIEWQDQAIQIDELTQRLAMLTKACKVAGVYNSSNPAINRLFNESIENELIPVDQWAMFAEGGGLKGAIDFVPLDQIQAAIQTLTEVRQQTMIDLDQITGLSDIIRGTSDSRETLGGIRLKNNNAGTRLSESQEEVARFARDTIRIMAEIICKHFSDESIIQASGILFEEALQPDTVMREWENDQRGAESQQPDSQQPQGQPGAQPGSPPQGQPGQAPQAQGQPPVPPAGAMAPPPSGGPSPPPGGANVIPFPQQQQAQGGPPQPGQQPNMPAAQPQPPDAETLIYMKINDALELLRDDVNRDYRIDIEADSTIFGDKVQDRQDAMEFLTAVSQYISQAEQLEQMPEAMPVFAKGLQWGVRKMRVGRDLEAEIDNFCEVIAKKAKQAMDNPKPDPEAQKAQAEVQKIQLQGQIQAQNDQRDGERQQQLHQLEISQAQAEHQQSQQEMAMKMELEKRKMEMEMQKMQMELEIAKQKHQMELQKLQMGVHAQHQEHQLKAQEQAMGIQHDERRMQMEEQHMGAQHSMEREQMHAENAMHKEQMASEAKMNKQQHTQKMEQAAQGHKQKMQQGAASHKQKMSQAKAAPKPKKSA